MPSFCAVVGCSSRANRDIRSFFRIPCIPKRGSPVFRELKIKRRLKWIVALRRADMTETKLNYALVCDRHFISGRPAKIEDVDNPDWIPSVNMGYPTHREAEKAISTPYIQYLRNTDAQQDIPNEIVCDKTLIEMKETAEVRQECVVKEESNSLSELIDANGQPICGNVLSNTKKVCENFAKLEDVSSDEIALPVVNSSNREFTFVNILKHVGD